MLGFVGLGYMGSRIARRLMDAGYPLGVYNRTREKMEPLIAQGAKAAASISDACQGDAVVTMLANDDAVQRVVFGEGAIVSSLPNVSSRESRKLGTPIVMSSCLTLSFIVRCRRSQITNIFEKLELVSRCTML